MCRGLQEPRRVPDPPSWEDRQLPDSGIRRKWGTRWLLSHSRPLHVQSDTDPGGQIPLVRRKLAQLLDSTEHKPGSLRWKTYTTAFNSIPVEFLFEAPTDEIAAIVETINYVERSGELRTHMVVDRENRKGLYFLVIPRPGYSEELRERIGKELRESLGATYSDSRVYFGKTETVLLSFFLTASDHFARFSETEVDERVRSLAGTWEDRFYRELRSALGRTQATIYFERYHRAFPEEYQLLQSPAEAVTDVHRLETVREDDGKEIAFEIMSGEMDRLQRTARLRIYLKKYVYLSTILPILDNFGLQIIDQAAVRIQAVGGRDLFIETFRVAGVEDAEHDLLVRREEIIEALEVVFERRVANDPLNRLVIEAGLSWRDVDMVRAYTNYLRQFGIVRTKEFIANTFRQHPKTTRLLLDYHHTRFDPAWSGDNVRRADTLRTTSESFLTSLHDVPSSEQDNFLRLLFNLFESTLRTTHFQPKEPDEYRLSFKIDSGRLLVGGEPKPWREIYVHHYGMEGVPPPWGKAGPRRDPLVGSFERLSRRDPRAHAYSDGQNVLIVPVGAKGGFVLRQPAPASAVRREQADQMYRVFVHGLLDLTDNIVDGEVISPPHVVCHDEEDSYLVLAADKGTAHLSDTANEVSESRGFWLGDAFASGGSNGYDHKALGITARAPGRE